MERDLAQWIPTLIATLALGIIYFDIRRFKSRLSEMFSGLRREVRTALYADDGITRFVPRGDCDRNSNLCQTHICGKIEELKVAIHKSESSLKDQLSAMDAKRERTRESLQSKFESLQASLSTLIGEFHARKTE